MYYKRGATLISFIIFFVLKEESKVAGFFIFSQQLFIYFQPLQGALTLWGQFPNTAGHSFLKYLVLYSKTSCYFNIRLSNIRKSSGYQVTGQICIRPNPRYDYKIATHTDGQTLIALLKIDKLQLFKELFTSFFYFYFYLLLVGVPVMLILL